MTTKTKDYLVQYETPTGEQRLMNVQAESTGCAGAAVVESLTGYKLNWAMRTRYSHPEGDDPEALSWCQRLMLKFFTRFS